MAVLTKFYGWGPRDMGDMTWKAVMEWHKHALKMQKEAADG
jgi:hypothetical protein